MNSIQPFHISVPSHKLDRLRQRLALSELPDELDNAGWDYGSPLKDIKNIVTYWEKEFDWRKIEQKLNSLSQYLIPIEVENFGTLRIHFIHEQSSVTNAIPLLFCHGWPGSFEEVVKMLPDLTSAADPHQPAFHVVAPSLVNFGFSEGTKQKGFRTRQHAEVCHKLMQSLGYTEYVTQGGDLGYGITRCMGLMYPSLCKASHLNVGMPRKPAHLNEPKEWEHFKSLLDAREKADVERSEWFENKGRGYWAVQGTKPQTLAYSLVDSPVGLLAWIFEKLHDWSDNYNWTNDEILTWVSIYMFSTAGPAAPQRIYYESQNDPEEMRGKLSEYIPNVKLGFARFPKELIITPRNWLNSLGPVVYVSEHDKGGHFAAWERPDAIVKDLRTMFGKGGGAFGAVEGKSGFD